LISGSGPQNRNSALFGFEIFRIIADQFTREGIAVLRYDDRGVGNSTGDILQATISDFSGDVLSAVELLQSRKDINGEQIGLLGHSEGGMVAPLVDSKSDAIAFLVLLAGPAVPGEDIILAQLELILRVNGATDAEIKEKIGLQMSTFEAVRTGEGWDGIEAGLQQQILAYLDDLPVEQRQAITDVDELVNSIIEERIRSIQSPWFQSLLVYDPAPDIEQVTIPVLALFGELDIQVPADMNRKAVERALEAGRNQDYTTVTLPRANHLFQEANTGSPAEYATLKKEFVPGFLDLITEWILERVKVASFAP
jgi:pimeloyl-ACP methyl ester carboxylesterase